ncbi:MAG: hypothetical protein KBD19_02405 [Candidatus Moranbacteria bacterium]|nr:hypothetical protein [Candidatus Moranbacteria bacterium]
MKTMKFSLPAVASRGFFLSLVSIIFLLSLPVPASADLITCGRGADIASACRLCDLVEGVADLVKYIRNIMVFIALAVITAMGILYIVSSGNQGTMETAKKGIFASLIGIAVILSAWLIVNTVMFTVFQAKGDLGVGASFSVATGFSFDCDASGAAATSGSVAVPASGTVTVPQGSSVSLPAGTTFSLPAGTQILQDGTLITVPASGIVTVPASGASYSFPSGATTISLPKGGTATISDQKPENCVITASPVTPSVGGGVSLTASCSKGTVPFSFSWTGDCTPIGERCVKNGITSGTHPYSVAVSNAAGSSDASIGITPGASSLNTFPLTVTTDGPGSVSVPSDTGNDGISCGSDCSGTYREGGSVLLTATPQSGYTVLWSGSCVGTGTTCSLVMDRIRAAKASFLPAPPAGTFRLTVSKEGMGTVMGTGIACGADCSEDLSGNPSVSLIATPDPKWTFDGWSGSGCSGTGACVVSVNAAKNVVASFSPTVYTVSVSVSGTGTVTAPGIDCPGTCSAEFPVGTPATLTASKASVSWSGDCSGSGATCVVSSANPGSTHSVSASFSGATGGGSTGGGSTGATGWYPGDPGHGNWFFAANNAQVVDPGANSSVMHIPACVNGVHIGAIGDSNSCYWGGNNQANGFSFGGTNVLSIRMRGVSAPSKFNFIRIEASDGGNALGNSKVSISSMPGDYSVDVGCLHDGFATATRPLYANSQADVDAVFGVGKSPPGANFCWIDPGAYYYLNIMLPDAVSGQQYYLKVAKPLQ